MLARIKHRQPRRLVALALLLAVALALVVGLGGAQPTLAQGPNKGGKSDFYWYYVPVRYVVVGDNYFWPYVIYVRQNTVVVWANNGQHAHTVTSGTPTGMAPMQIPNKGLEDATPPAKGLPPMEAAPAGVDITDLAGKTDAASATSFDGNLPTYADAFVYTFRERGVFYYYCKNHPSMMRGVVVVY